MHEDNLYLKMTHAMKDDLTLLLLMSINLRPALDDNNSWEVNQGEIGCKVNTQIKNVKFPFWSPERLD